MQVNLKLLFLHVIIAIIFAWLGSNGSGIWGGICWLVSLWYAVIAFMEAIVISAVSVGINVNNGEN